MNRYLDPTYRLKSHVRSVKSVTELREMEPGRVFARWLQARSPEDLSRDDKGHEPWGVPDEEAWGKATRAYRYVALGSVLDSSEIAYVVYRQAFSPNDIYPGVMDDWERSVPADEAELARVTHYLHSPHVATCRRQGDGSWRLVADTWLNLFGTLQVVDVRTDTNN